MELSDILTNKKERYSLRFERMKSKLENNPTYSEIADVIGLMNYKTNKGYVKRKYNCDESFRDDVNEMYGLLWNKLGISPVENSYIENAIKTRMKIDSRLDIIEEKVNEYKNNMDLTKNIELSFALSYLNNDSYLKRKSKGDKALRKRIKKIGKKIEKIKHSYSEAYEVINDKIVSENYGIVQDTQTYNQEYKPVGSVELNSIEDAVNPLEQTLIGQNHEFIEEIQPGTSFYERIFDKYSNALSSVRNKVKETYNTVKDGTKWFLNKIDGKPQYTAPLGLIGAFVLDKVFHVGKIIDYVFSFFSSFFH